MPTTNPKSDAVAELLTVEENVLKTLVKRKNLSRFAKDKIRDKLEEVERRKREHENNG